MAMNKVGAKKSIFKKPAWASTSAKPADGNEPIFGQAHYQEILEAEKKRRERHAAKQQELAERNRLEEEARAFKRRRLSKEAEDSDYGSDSDARSVRSESASSQRSQKSGIHEQEEDSEQLKGKSRLRKNRLVDQLDTTSSPQTRSQTVRAAASDTAIVLDDDNDLSVQSGLGGEGRQNRAYRNNAAKSTLKAKQPEPEPESEEEDEYLRELKAKARQQARLKKTVVESGKADISGSLAVQDPADVLSPTPLTSASPPTRTEPHSARATSTPAPDDEAEVKIWIKTIIPGAKEIIVNRKVSQPLDKVKEFWIKRNELDPAIANRVFFTWNGTRLYNSTTMRGIIERLKKTHPSKDGSDPSEGRIMIEAVTDEIFQYRQEQRARRQAEAEAEANPGGDQQADGQNVTVDGGDGNINTPGEDGTPAPSAAQATRPGIVVKLIAQGLDEVSIRVRPNTTMRKILSGFCKVNKVEMNEQSWLSYDGDKLEPDTTVEEVGFEHEDTVEVYLR